MHQKKTNLLSHKRNKINKKINFNKEEMTYNKKSNIFDRFQWSQSKKERNLWV